MAIDHMGFAVADFLRSLEFYRAALAPLGITVVREGENWAMMGTGGRGEFWFGDYRKPPGPIHIAFAAPDRAAVDAFHAAALAAGGADNGPPGIRANYHADYYAAFVLDPDGHNIEAVCDRG
jgi:catechol 2,3-dioxygenase-like lactoylglutathione lyase family enzyme